jgi:hypothetical protein
MQIYDKVSTNIGNLLINRFDYIKRMATSPVWIKPKMSIWI